MKNSYSIYLLIVLFLSSYYYIPAQEDTKSYFKGNIYVVDVYEHYYSPFYANFIEKFSQTPVGNQVTYTNTHDHKQTPRTHEIYIFETTPPNRTFTTSTIILYYVTSDACKIPISYYSYISDSDGIGEQIYTCIREILRYLEE